MKNNKVMTPEEFKEAMLSLDNGDPEVSHHCADNLMCDLLEQLGYSEGVDVFIDMERWYA